MRVRPEIGVYGSSVADQLARVTRRNAMLVRWATDLALLGDSPKEEAVKVRKAVPTRLGFQLPRQVDTTVTTWTSPLVAIRTLEGGRYFAAVTKVDELVGSEGTKKSRRARLGFFAVAATAVENIHSGVSAELNSEEQVGGWLRTYAVDGEVLGIDQEPGHDELHRIMADKRWLRGAYLGLVQGKLRSMNNQKQLVAEAFETNLYNQEMFERYNAT